MSASSIEGATAEQPGRRLLVLVGLYLIFVAGFALWVLEQSLEVRHTSIYFDEWASLFQRSQHSFFRWLFLHHNGHLIPATKLLLHWDYEQLSGRGGLPLAVSFLCTGITIALFYRLLRRHLIGDALLWRMLGAFFAFCLLWSSLFYGFLWSFSVHAPITTLCSSVSIACIVEFAARQGSRAGAEGRWLVVVSCAGAFAASVSSAAGIGSWAALLVVALMARLSWKVIIGIVAGGCVSGILLAIAPAHWGTSADMLGLTLQFPVRLLASLLSFLGGPVAWTIGALLGLSEAHRFQTGMWAGGIGVLGLLALSVRTFRSGKAPDALTLLGIGLMAYSFAAAILVAVGRAIFEIDSVRVRYTPFAIPFWMGVAVVGASAVHAAGTSRARVLLASILFTASIAMLPALETKLERHRRQRDINTIALLQIMVGIRNDGFLSKVTKNSDNARVLLPILERDRRGPFADPRYSLLGRPISEVYAGISPVRCRGSITSSRPIDAGGAQGAVINGIADQARGAPALSFILVTDAQGTIRGLGNLRPGAGPRKVRWVAYLGPYSPEHAFEVYAELEDGSICRFDRAPRRIRVERE